MRFIVALLLLLTLGSAGCGKNTSSTDTLSPKIFDTAAPEARAAWDQVLRAVKEDDYKVAILTLEQLRTNRDLSAPQIQTMSNAESAVREKMNAAARKGDTNAQKAIEDLKKTYLDSRGKRGSRAQP
jgi:hypothetical protein